MTDTLSPSVPEPRPLPRGDDLPPSHDALDLTGGGPVATIMLDDQRYALRITRQRKLILTK